MSNFRFSLPALPKPDYMALKQLVERYEATQSEIVCTGIRLICRLLTDDRPLTVRDIQRELDSYRATAPSQQPPLLPEKKR